MIGKHVLAAASISMMLLAGCDERPKTATKAAVPTATATATAVDPSAEAKPAAAVDLTTAPAPTAVVAVPHEAPHSTFLALDTRTQQWVPVNFPRARLHIDRDQKMAVLYSDDPKTAIDSKYVGNSYYVEIPLTEDALLHLDGFSWHYKAASSEHQDSTNGIFEEGQRIQLQPSDVTVTFVGENPMVSVILEGTFNQFDMSQSPHEGTMVAIKGMVSATVDQPK